MTEPAYISACLGGIAAFVSGLLALCMWGDRKNRRELAEYMCASQVIKGVFLPAPNDESSAKDTVTLGKVQIRFFGGNYALKIGDVEITHINYSSVGSFGYYCLKTHDYHQELHDQREGEEKLNALAEASEKHVAGLIE